MSEPEDKSVLLAEEVRALRTRLAKVEHYHAWYEAIYHLAPILIVRTTHEVVLPRIVDCNDFFCEVLGFTPEQVIGRYITDFYTSASQFALERDYLRSLDRGIRLVERELVAADGNIVYTLLSASPDVDPTTGEIVGMLAMFIDITERKQAEARLAEGLAQQMLISTLSWRMNNLPATEIAGEIESSLGDVALFTNADFGYIIELGPVRGVGSCSFAWHGPTLNAASALVRERLTGLLPWLRQCMDAREVVWLPNAAALPEDAAAEQAIYQETSLCSLLCVPVVINDAVVAFVAFGTLHAEARWSSDIADLLRILGELVLGAAERRARLMAEQARQAAELASRQKSLFLALMSHEMRTPMNGIFGMANILLDKDLPEEVASGIEVIKSSASQLMSLIEDILDFAKLEAGTMQIAEVVFDLTAVIQAAVAPLRQRAKDKGLMLRVELGPAIPAQVWGDPDRITQVLRHLVQNAIKFTERGGIDVYVDAERVIGENVVIRASVHDTGSGIPAEARGRLFEPFTRMDVSLTRKHSGTGLGLALCSRVIERLGGSIGYDDSSPGALFWFTVPLRLAHERHAGMAREDRPALSHEPSRCRVLVVDDNRVNQLVIQRQLQAIGYNVDVVSSGYEALDLLASQHYDVVLMDCQMPGIDGYETTRRLRAREGASTHIPVIAVTAHASQSDRESCLRAGMDDYVAKPFRREELIALIDRYIAQYVGQHLGPSPASSPE